MELVHIISSEVNNRTDCCQGICVMVRSKKKKTKVLVKYMETKVSTLQMVHLKILRNAMG